jgi:hypothetical protein
MNFLLAKDEQDIEKPLEGEKIQTTNFIQMTM